MSAECEIHGTDLVGTQWDEGGLTCPVCNAESARGTAMRERDEALKRLDMAESLNGSFEVAVGHYQAKLARCEALVERWRKDGVPVYYPIGPTQGHGVGLRQAADELAAVLAPAEEGRKG